MNPSVPTGTLDETFFLFCKNINLVLKKNEQKMLKNTAVFVDAGYLSEISKYFGNGKYLKTDIVKFCQYLAIKADLWLDKIYYYTAPPFQGNPPLQDEIKLKAGYDKFISKLSKNSNVIVREGRVQKLNTFKQKGVDTLLVMDLMAVAASKRYSTIVLLICDTDFVPIINKLIKEDNIKIVLYYFTDRIRKSKFSMSNELLNACKDKVLLTKEFFIRNQLQDK